MQVIDDQDDALARRSLARLRNRIGQRGSHCADFRLVRCTHDARSGERLAQPSRHERIVVLQLVCKRLQAFGFELEEHAEQHSNRVVGNRRAAVVRTRANHQITVLIRTLRNLDQEACPTDTGLADDVQGNQLVLRSLAQAVGRRELDLGVR